MKLELLRPTLAMKDMYLDYASEWESKKEKMVPMASSLHDSSYEDWFQERMHDNEPEYMKSKGLVPADLFFYVDTDANYIIGAIQVRHSLNEYLLQYGGHIGYGIRPSKRGKGYGKRMLAEALKYSDLLGIKKALITCDKVNSSSRKVICANGGVLEDEVLEGEKLVQRFWIDVLPSKEPERQYYFMELLKKEIQKDKEELGRDLTFNVQTFGCQMNAKDSEKLAGILETIGYVATDTEDADFVIYNTCTVRENANTRVYGRIGYLGNLKKKNPHKFIALCGCMMQEEHVVDKIKQSYHFVDVIFGTHNIYKMAELMYQRRHSSKMVIDIWKEADQIVEELPTEQKFSFKAGVNIMYGCNNFCSYCIVPYVRGRERSRNPEDIVHEIETMVKNGVVEVMLLGQNVNSYGKTLENPITFAQLLQKVEAIEGLHRIRFMTPHPKDLSDEVIEVMKNSKKICNHLHLPVQAGSTKLLKAMNRKYTKEDYLNLVERVKTAMPDISLTTDIIIGFPGETEEDFLDTLDVVQRARYDSAYTFLYSKRSGTKAATMENQVPDKVAKERFDRLLVEVQKISRELAQEDEGKIVEVLVEEINEQDHTLVTGRMKNNMLVHFKGDASLIGSLPMVKLTQCKGFYYLGELVS